ncbi:hypothetical protein D3C72_1390700 [compost metagenome]
MACSANALITAAGNEAAAQTARNLARPSTEFMLNPGTKRRIRTTARMISSRFMVMNMTDRSGPLPTRNSPASTPVITRTPNPRS